MSIEIVNKTQKTLPTDGNNYPIELVYTDGNLTSIIKTIGTSSYTKTLTYVDGVLSEVSAWVKDAWR